MTIKFEKNVEIKTKLGTLETKIKDKEKSKNKYKPLIISIDNNKNINSRNNSMNLKLNLKSDKINKKKLFNLILDDDMLNIPPSIRELFTEKELKAILLGLGKNKEKCKNLFKKINVHNTYVNTLANKHKLDLKKKLDQINELDEHIEFLIIKEYDDKAIIESYKKQIEEETEVKKIYCMKVSRINKEKNKKKILIEKKNREIKELKEQFLKLKKLIKNGEIELLKNEFEIEEDKKNNEAKKNKEDEDNENITSNKITKKTEKKDDKDDKEERSIETSKTEGTGYEEDNENNLNIINLDNKNINKLYNKEEHISSNNSISSNT